VRQSFACKPNTYLLPRLAIEPYKTAALPVRSQTSRPICGSSRASGGWPIKCKTCCMRSSEIRLRKGDCSNCTDRPWRSVPSNTGSPVELAKSASTTVSFSVKTLRLWAKDRNATVPEVIRISSRSAAIQGRLSGRSDSARASGSAELVPVASMRWTDPTEEGKGARKRYPRLGTVSMYRGFSASSPSASLNLRTATRRLASKSTKVFSSQMRLWICSRLTTRPAFSRRKTSRRKGWSCSLTRRPCLRSSPDPGCTSKGPNS
jgi:hypothetical protein